MHEHCWHPIINYSHLQFVSDGLTIVIDYRCCHCGLEQKEQDAVWRKVGATEWDIEGPLKARAAEHGPYFTEGAAA